MIGQLSQPGASSTRWGMLAHVGHYHGGMAKRTAIDQVRKACIALPEAEERPFGGHTAPSFRVREKFFAMTSEDGQSLTFKVPPGVNAILVGDNPQQFF